MLLQKCLRGYINSLIVNNYKFVFNITPLIFFYYECLGVKWDARYLFNPWGPRPNIASPERIPTREARETLVALTIGKRKSLIICGRASIYVVERDFYDIRRTMSWDLHNRVCEFHMAPSGPFIVKGEKRERGSWRKDFLEADVKYRLLFCLL